MYRPLGIRCCQDAVKKTYKNKGDAIVNQNIKAVEAAIAALHPVSYDAAKWAAVDCDRESFYAKEIRLFRCRSRSIFKCIYILYSR